jgi:very-short-patch-repair endonuclease
MHWSTPRGLWDKLKPIAREMRRTPTPAEDRLWQELRNRKLAGLKFRRQHPIERFIVDFYCQAAALVVEVDGALHENTKDRDAVRQQFLELNGLRVIRFSNEAVLARTEEVLAAIVSAATSSSAVSPSPFTERGLGGEVPCAPDPARTSPSPFTERGPGGEVP